MLKTANYIIRLKSVNSVLSDKPEILKARVLNKGEWDIPEKRQVESFIEWSDASFFGEHVAGQLDFVLEVDAGVAFRRVYLESSFQGIKWIAQGRSKSDRQS